MTIFQRSVDLVGDIRFRTISKDSDQNERTNDTNLQIVTWSTEQRLFLLLSGFLRGHSLLDFAYRCRTKRTCSKEEVE